MVKIFAISAVALSVAAVVAAAPADDVLTAAKDVPKCVVDCIKGETGKTDLNPADAASVCSAFEIIGADTVTQNKVAGCVTTGDKTLATPLNGCDVTADNVPALVQNLTTYLTNIGTACVALKAGGGAVSTLAGTTSAVATGAATTSTAVESKTAAVSTTAAPTTSTKPSAGERLAVALPLAAVAVAAYFL
ncbi:hypothetical protein HDU97_009845 [Phlyctochytrium planicorne]|nr:hypothetical protein HDU97_009845 [Phlyctochytrium planicorne]